MCCLTAAEKTIVIVKRWNRSSSDGDTKTGNTGTRDNSNVSVTWRELLSIAQVGFAVTHSARP